MIIKLIPETASEKERFTVTEHTGVNEFLIFGAKSDSDGHSVEFHDWTGSFRTLIGGCAFYEHVLVADQQKRIGSAGNMPPVMMPPQAPVDGALPFPQPPEVPAVADGDVVELAPVEVPEAIVEADEGTLEVVDDAPDTPPVPSL